MKHTHPKLLVYMQVDRLAFKGGPFAVGYCYYHEMLRRGENRLDFLPLSKASKKEAKVTYKKNGLLHNILHNIRLFLYFTMKYFKAKPKHNLFEGYDIIHFHSTQELFLERNNLKDFKGKVILQSHSPMPLGEELYDLIEYRYKRFIPFFKKRLENMDEFAFLRADIIVFPCEDAEEPYLNRWPKYANIKLVKKNAYRYVLTGIPYVAPKRTKDEVFYELNLSDDTFLLSYAGRHNEAKGYDILKEVASKMFSFNDKVAFVVAGKEHPMTRLCHNRWLELGWTDDAKSYISASDVYLLPNRETYFDLVMIEVLSLGKIIVASRTGGNKYFEKNRCPGVFLYDTIDECVEILHRLSEMTAIERTNIGQQNYEFYLAHLTVEKMYDSYLNMINSII